jgi:hypothetical protein
LNNKTNQQTKHKTVMQFSNPIFGSRKIKIRNTVKAVTPFAGMVSLIEFFNRIGLAAQIENAMPFQLKSPNAIPPAHTMTAFLFSVIAGASRFAHSDWLRSDKALHAMLGIEGFPGTDTIRNFFARFTQASVQAFWRPLWAWTIPMVKVPLEGFSLDLDSTLFQRSGHQEGAKKGYNPHRPGRMSHHPLLAVLAEAQFVLHAWLRSGNTTVSKGIPAFLSEALAQLGAGIKIRIVRADSGFFCEELLAFLEERALSYIIVARMSAAVKRAAAGLCQWIAVDETYSVGSFSLALAGWSQERRFVVVRERIKEKKSPLGRKLIEVPGYTFRIFVTNRNEDPLVLWRDYNKRAIIEQRIEELKNELHADGFCMKEFFSTESAFLAVLFTFNLLSLYQKALAPEAKYRQPATLRSAVFLCGGILGNAARRPVLHISSAWGGLAKHAPLINAILQWKTPTSPKLETALNQPLENCTI